MTPIDALKLLDNLASQVPLKREDHAKVALAVRVIYDALNLPPEAKEE